MKELSIEEKAKRYDEAIEKAKEINNEHQAQPFDVMTRVFPELKESEDERIREDIIRCLKHSGIKPDRPINPHVRTTMKDALAWLEKQGEQKSIDMSIKEKAHQIAWEYSKHYDPLLSKESWCEMAALDMASWLEKQGEQKPNYCHHEVDLSECSEEYRKAYYDGWNNCNMQHSQCKSELDDVVKCLINGMKFYYEDNKEATWGTDKWSMPVKHIIEVLEKQGEQMPVGKVEPKFHEGDIIIHKELGGDYIHNPHKIIQVDISDKKYRLEGGLVAHFGEQDDYELVEQKPAWSEEDEKVLHAIRNALNYEKPRNYLKSRDFEFTDILDWLKSLRPQSQWKPSEEHYELEEFAKIVRGNLTGVSKAVQKLFEAKYLQLTGNKMYGGFKDLRN